MKKQKVLQVVAVGTITLSTILGTNIPILAVEESDIVNEEQGREGITENNLVDESSMETAGEISDEKDPDAAEDNNAGQISVDEQDSKENDESSEQSDEQEENKETREFADPGTLPGLSGQIEFEENGYRLKNTGGNNLAISTVTGKAFQFDADIEYVNGQNVSLVFGSADNKFFGLEFKREDNGNILVKLFQDGPGGLGDGVFSYVPAGSIGESKTVHVNVAVDNDNTLSITVNGNPVAFEFAKDFKGTYEGGQFGLLTWNTEAIVSNITLNASAIPEAPKSNFITNVANIHGLQGTWKETEEGLYSSGNGDNFARSDTVAKNVQFSANVRSVNKSGAGTIAIRTKDNPRDGGYYLNVDYSANIFKLFSFPSGGTIASVPMGQVAANEDGSYDLTIQMVDDHIRVFANGIGIMDVKNTEHSDAGYLSLLTWNDTVVYQNVMYEEMKEMEEIEEPGLTDLEISPAKVSITEAIDPAVTIYGIDVPSEIGTVTLKPKGNGNIRAQKFDENWKALSEVVDLGTDGVLTIEPDEFVENFMNVQFIVENDKGFTKAYTFTINQWIATSDLANEEYRSQFHVTPQTNFMNDPNGMVYDSTEGYWHMFYQYSPKNGFYNQSWAHVRSKDLVNWEQMPLGIQIDDNGLIFSGCAIEDTNNTSGLFTDNKEGESKLIAYFTYHGPDGKQAQAMAYSKDHGVTWKKNGVILDNSHTLSGNDFRDPKVFQIEGDNDHWYMVTAGGAAQIFASSDLLNWERVQNLTYKNGEQIHSECPMMYPAVDEETGKTMWIYGGSAGFYVVGEMTKNDKGLFEWKAVSDKIDVESNENPWGGFGKYATMTFYHNNENDDRTIGVSWLQDFVDFEGRGYRGVQSLPQTYGLKKVNGKYVITSYVVDEVDQLRVADPVYSTKKTVSAADGNILQGVSGITYDLEAVFTPKGADTFGFKLRKGNGQEIVYSYDVKNQKMNVDVSNAGPHQSHGRYSQTLVPDENGQVHMRILVDQGAVEAFGNYGEANISTVVYCDPANIGMEFFTDGEVQIDALNVYDMKSMYSGEGNFLGQNTRLVIDAPTYVKPGQEFTVSANIYPNASIKDIVWTTEGLEVVKQTDTSLTLKTDKAGEYTIKASVGEQSQEAAVTVDDPQFIHNTEEWTNVSGSWNIDHQGLKANNLGSGDCFYLSNATIDKNEPFMITTNLKVEKGQAIGVVFGVKDPENPGALWYCANIDTVDGVAKMFKNANGQQWNVKKALGEIPVDEEGWYTIEVDYDGTTLVYTVNGIEVGRQDVSNDKDFEKGVVGFVSFKANGTIKDLVIDTDNELDENHLQSIKEQHAAKVYEITDQQSEEDLRSQLVQTATLKKTNGTIVKRNISWDLSQVEFGKAGEYEAYGTFMSDVMPIIEGEEAVSDLVSKVRILPTVDKTKLSETIQSAGTLKESDYTPKSWKAFVQALNGANEIANDENATQEEVDAANEALTTAMQALKQKADTTKLKEECEKAKAIVRELYTPESLEAFDQAYAEAIEVLENQNATQQEVDEAQKALSEAQANLKEAEQPIVVDKTKLEEAIKSAEALKESDYTPESWKTFVQALNEANEIANDENATQEDVDAAHKALSEAQGNLKKAQQLDPSTVDKTKLEEAIQKAEELKKTDYTEKSWNVFVEALKQAKEIAGQKDASQADVDKALESLNSAMKDLAKANTSSTTTGTNSSTKGSTTTTVRKSSANTAAKTGAAGMMATAGASLLGILALLKKRNKK